MRRAAKVDGNQEAIVRALRLAGAWVESTAALGNGFPDLLVWRGRFMLMELKDESQPPSKRRLSPAEADFFATCPGPVFLVHSPKEAVAALSANGRGTAETSRGTSRNRKDGETGRGTP